MNTKKNKDKKQKWTMISPQMLENTRKQTSTREGALSFLIEAGILDKRGELSKQYRTA